MKISKTLLIPIFLTIGSCVSLKSKFTEQHRAKLEAQSYSDWSYLSHVIDVLSRYDFVHQPSKYREIFASNYKGSGAPWPYGVDAGCENFYLVYKEYLKTLEYLSNLDDKNGEEKIDSNGQ